MEVGDVRRIFRWDVGKIRIGKQGKCGEDEMEEMKGGAQNQ